MHGCRQGPVEDVVYQGGLARARDAGDADEAAQGYLDVDGLEVVVPGALHGHLAVETRAPFGNGNLPFPFQIGASEAASGFEDVVHSPLGNDLSPALPGPRPHVDDVVG